MKSVQLEKFSVSIGARALVTASFELQEGESAALVGATGTGKSLLMRAIAGLLPASGFVTGGNLNVLTAAGYLGGRKAKFDQWLRLRDDGLVFVPPEPALVLNAALTLAQNLRIFTEQDSGLVEHRLHNYFGLTWTQFSGRYPDEVSGGELQRISLMILLARKARVVLLDEPTVSLDSDLRVAFLEFVNKELLTGGGAGAPVRSLLFASHDLELVHRLTVHRCLRLELGHLVEGTAPPESDQAKVSRTAGSTPELRVSDLSQVWFTPSLWSTKKSQAFSSITVNLGPSHVYGLRGSSGCGKSSFFKALLRLVSGTTGTIEFENTDLVGTKPHEVGSDPEAFRRFRKKMGIVGQESRFAFLPDRSVRASLRLAFRKAGLDVREGERRVEVLLASLSLRPELLEARPLTLSSGEAKRLDILRALACDLDILFLDEPFAYIDYETRRLVMDTLSLWLERRARILVVVTHEDFDLVHFADSTQDFNSLSR